MCLKFQFLLSQTIDISNHKFWLLKFEIMRVNYICKKVLFHVYSKSHQSEMHIISILHPHLVFGGGGKGSIYFILSVCLSVTLVTLQGVSYKSCMLTSLVTPSLGTNKL